MISLALLLFASGCDNPDQHFDNALVAFEMRNFWGAASLMTHAIDSGKLDEVRLAQAYKVRGISRLFTGNPFGASADLEAAIRLSPSDAELRHGRAMALINLGQYADALLEVDRAVELNTEDSVAFGNRCDVLRLMRRFEDALKDCNRAISLDPQFAFSWFERAKLYRDWGLHDAARSDTIKAYELWPEHPRIRQFAREYGVASD